MRLVGGQDNTNVNIEYGERDIQKGLNLVVWCNNLFIVLDNNYNASYVQRHNKTLYFVDLYNIDSKLAKSVSNEQRK